MRVKRSRTVAADAETVWQLVSDPWSLPRWWPDTERVEEATPATWTKVLRSQRGKPVRADYTRVEANPPKVLEWRQEIAESPFERFLREARTRIVLTEEGPGTTRIEIAAVRRLRGLALFGGVMIRRATARQLDEALAGLADALPERGGVAG